MTTSQKYTTSTSSRTSTPSPTDTSLKTPPLSPFSSTSFDTTSSSDNSQGEGGGGGGRIPVKFYPSNPAFQQINTYNSNKTRPSASSNRKDNDHPSAPLTVQTASLGNNNNKRHSTDNSNYNTRSIVKKTSLGNMSKNGGGGGAGGGGESNISSSVGIQNGNGNGNVRQPSRKGSYNTTATRNGSIDSNSPMNPVNQVRKFKDGQNEDEGLMMKERGEESESVGRAGGLQTGMTKPKRRMSK